MSHHNYNYSNVKLQPLAFDNNNGLWAVTVARNVTSNFEYCLQVQLTIAVNDVHKYDLCRTLRTSKMYKRIKYVKRKKEKDV